jgi:hypothetical protein
MKIAAVLNTLSLTTLIAVAGLAGACSSDDPDEGDGDAAGDGDGDEASGLTFCSPTTTCPPDVADVDLATEVQFRRDIYEGYFVDSCGGGSGCHGGASTAAAGLYLGDTDSPLDDDQISMLILQLTSTMSKIAPTEKLVDAGNWEDSWLMAKLDGCQSSYGVACDEEADELILSLCNDACGDGMPASEGTSSNPNAFPTSEAERAKVHLVRAWIEQGALDN